MPFKPLDEAIDFLVFWSCLLMAILLSIVGVLWGGGLLEYGGLRMGSNGHADCGGVSGWSTQRESWL